MKSSRNDFSIHTNFLTMITISLIDCCRKGVYPYEYMDDWENSIKHHYLKKKIFIVAQIWKILVMQFTRMQKEFVKVLK